MIVRNICSRSNEMSAHHRAKSPLTISEMCTRPTLAPHIRFLSISSHFCSTLPSDPALRRRPLRFAIPSPPSG